MSAKQEKIEARDNAISRLRELITPGKTVYTNCNHVSRSGMTRHISCYVSLIDEATKQPYQMNISGYVALALEEKRNPKSGGVVIGGCGMDMGFALVNSLSYVLHGTVSKGKGLTSRNPLYKNEIDSENYSAGYSISHEWI